MSNQGQFRLIGDVPILHNDSHLLGFKPSRRTQPELMSCTTSKWNELLRRAV